MKFTKLLALSAFWFAGVGSAMATVPDGVWSISEPQGLEFTTFTDDGTHYYLYNPGAKMFFASGNSWNTQASVRSYGYAFWLQSSTEADAPSGSYELWNYVNNPDRTDVTGSHNLFTDDGGSTWVDHGSQGNYSWTFTIVGDCVRFQNVALIADLPEFEGKYIGWTGTYEGAGYSSVLKMIAPDTEGTCIDWKAVTETSYEAFVNSDNGAAYVNSVECFFVADQLRSLLVEAESLGASITELLAIYTNTQSTLDELNAAIETTKQVIEERKAELIDQEYGNATGTKPVNVTDKFLKNVDFKTSLTEGWSGDAFGAYNGKENVEHYNKTYNTYQSASGLREGVYAVGVNAFYRAGNAANAYTNYKAQNEQSRYAKLYASAGGETEEVSIVSPYTAGLTEGTGQGTESTATDAGVTYYIPNNMVAAEYYMHTLGKYANKVFFEAPADADLTLGVRKDETVSEDWSIFDDFSLVYYGKGADAYQAWLDATIEVYYPDFNLSDDDLYTESYVEAYDNARYGKTASNKNEVKEALATIDGLKADVSKNIELWKQYQEAIKPLRDYTGNMTFGAKADLEGSSDFANAFYDMADYDEEEYVGIIAARNLTNEQLEEEISKIKTLIAAFEDAIKNDITPGMEVTSMLTNPDFENGATGWEGNPVMGSGGGNTCAEAYARSNFDIYQEVTGLKVGVYSIEVQGFFRLQRPAFEGGQAWNYWENGQQIAPAFVYLNDVKTPLKCIYDLSYLTDEQKSLVMDGAENNIYNQTNIDAPGDGYQYPNTMEQAAQAFAAGLYKSQAFGLIASSEDVLRIGVKGSEGSNDWAIWDNFKLVYEGYEFNTIKPLLEEAIADIDTKMSEVNANAEAGKQAIGKSVSDKIATVKANATSAISSSNGETAFKALIDAVALIEEIEKSAALFEKLLDEIGKLDTAMDNPENDEYKAEVEGWLAEVNDNLSTGVYDDEDVEALIEEIAKHISKLAQPNPALASDNDPNDVTGVIVNPDYEVSTGWSGTAAAYDQSCAEMFNKDFDYYQDLNYLHEGVYEVRVQGFYRAGGAAEDYSSWIADPTANNNAYIYAVNGNGEKSSIKMKRLASEASEEFTLMTDYVWAQEPADEMSMGLAVPNMMSTAQEQFTAQKYKNEGLFVKVGADGKLRIGIMKEVNIDQNWTIWDSWQLLYYGKNSSHTATPDGISEVSDGTATGVEYFTIDGRKALNNQKGIMIQKVTMSNGTVEVKKVRR